MAANNEIIVCQAQTFRSKFWVFPIIAPQLSGQITYSPPNHGKYTIMGGLYFHGGAIVGKTRNFLEVLFDKFLRDEMLKVQLETSRILESVEMPSVLGNYSDVFP